MSDIVESLCLLPLVHNLPVGVADVTSDAATEITLLREQVRVLRAALTEARDSVSVWDVHSIARAALEVKCQD